MIGKVDDLVANDCNSSLKKILEALNIAKDTIRLSLKENLGKTKVCEKFVPHTITEERKSLRFWPESSLCVEPLTAFTGFGTVYFLHIS